MSRCVERWLTTAMAALMLSVGCSTTPAGGSGAWVRDYSDRPDVVWRAIHLVLDDLGYEVESEDRRRGTIWAAALTDQPFRGVALKIDLLERAETVRVHVHIGGGDGAPEDVGRLRTAATEFLATLDLKLDAPDNS